MRSVIAGSTLRHFRAIIKMMFVPITATPFPHSGYCELLPCKKLAPYVRCFWASWNEKGVAPSPEMKKAQSVIIPDLCSDIIVITDGAERTEDGRVISSIDFCGVNDKMFWSGHSPDFNRQIFGIRFYSWQASHFSDEPLSKTTNGYFDLRSHFNTAEKLLRQKISPVMTLHDFKIAAEDALLALLARPAQKVPAQNHLVLDSIIQMISTCGSQNLSSLLKDIHTSERQLERLFENTLSLSPKKVSSLIRYQSLWQNVCRSDSFDIQDAVYAYGYFDQAHLLNDFKKFHGMSLGEAKQLSNACRNFTIQKSQTIL